MDIPGRKKKAKGAAPVIDGKAIVVQLGGRKDEKQGAGSGGPAAGDSRGRGRSTQDTIEEAIRALASTPVGDDSPAAKEGSSMLFNKVEAPLKKVKTYDEADVQRRTWKPFTDGTRWECMKCGRCCRENWRVNLTWEEHDRLEGRLDVKHVVVDEASGMSHPVMIIEGRCRALDPERNTCTIYRKRAYSCATFPFSLTPEGSLMVSRYCEGFGKGPVVSEADMVKYILKWRRRAGMSKEHLKRVAKGKL